MGIWEDNGRRFTRPLKTLQSGKFLFQVSTKKTLKKTQKKAHRSTSLCTSGVRNSDKNSLFWCPCACLWEIIDFCYFSLAGLRNPTFQPKPAWNQPIHTTFLFHNTIIDSERTRSRWSQSLWASRDESLLNLSL